MKKAEEMMTEEQKKSSEKRETEIEKKEKLEKLLKMANELALNFEKIEKAGLKIDLKWPGETRGCNCNLNRTLGEGYCERNHIPNVSFKKTDQNTFSIKSELVYCRGGGANARYAERDTRFEEELILGKDNLIYDRGEYAHSGAWGNKQEFVFDKDDIKETKQIKAHLIKHDKAHFYGNGDSLNVATEKMEEYVPGLVKKLNDQVKNSLEKAKKALE